MADASPLAFISYAWENDAHRAWVLNLATELRKNAVDVILDRWETKIGDDLTAFMDASISRADYLLLVCTETYAAKADARQGGVGYEQTIISGELLTSSNSVAKLVPILRSGNPSSALPRYLRTRLFVDFRDDLHYANALEQLLRHLYKVPEYERPSLGPPPVFAGAQQSAPVSSVQPTGWILVAGTGHLPDFSDRLRETSDKLGREIASAGFGLITGGWPGVDDSVARGFAAEIAARGWSLEDFLTQVISDHQEPVFPAGNLIIVKKGTAEWTEAIDRANTVILIGGLGGTWKTGEIALGSGKLVLPLADTGGDALQFYMHMLKNWERIANPGITKAQFQMVARPAPDVAHTVVTLLASTRGQR